MPQGVCLGNFHRSKRGWPTFLAAFIRFSSSSTISCKPVLHPDIKLDRRAHDTCSASASSSTCWCFRFRSSFSSEAFGALSSWAISCRLTCCVMPKPTKAAAITATRASSLRRNLLLTTVGSSCRNLLRSLWWAHLLLCALVHHNMSRYGPVYGWLPGAHSSMSLRQQSLGFYNNLLRE